MATPAQLSPVTDVIAFLTRAVSLGTLRRFTWCQQRPPVPPRPAGALSARKECERDQVVLLQRHHLSPVGVRGQGSLPTAELK